MRAPPAGPRSNLTSAPPYLASEHNAPPRAGSDHGGSDRQETGDLRGTCRTTEGGEPTAMLCPCAVLRVEDGDSDKGAHGKSEGSHARKLLPTGAPFTYRGTPIRSGARRRPL